MYSGLPRNPADIEYTPETPLTQRAEAIAAEAHDATGAKYGRSKYMAHPRMAAQLLKEAGYGEIVQAAGLLHDVIEDTDETPATLLLKMTEGAADMDEENARILVEDSILVIKAVIALTKKPHDTWDTKIGRVMGDPVAEVIKSHGDAQSHLDYIEWKIKEKIRRRRTEKRRLRKYHRTQDDIGSTLSPEEIEDLIMEEKLALGWTE